MNPAVERQLARWYPLKDHPVQLALMRAVDEGVRFPVVPAGRRSGKSERFKRFVAKRWMGEPGQKYFIAAPTLPQVKKIYWDDMKALCLTAGLPRSLKPSESDYIIFGPNGSEIHLIGLDSPERIEGTEWTGGGIDEIANIKRHAWDAHIYPALNTVNPTRPDYRAWCWLIGVPDGLNHYYDMAQMAMREDLPEWGYYHWKSSEILPPDVIENAKRTMPHSLYLQEYEASFETATGRIYPDYGPENHSYESIQSHERLLWMHDQNYTPLSSAIGVRRGDSLYLLDEIVLTSAVSRESALEFVDKYRDHRNKVVELYGDPAGRAGEKHGQESAYTQIEEVLRAHGWRVERRVAKSAPAIKDRQNAVRARICNTLGERRLFVNPNAAPYCHKGLATVQLKTGSTFIEDQTNDYQHITTAIGYCVDQIWPILGTIDEININYAT